MEAGAAYCVGVDLGGTKLAAAIGDADGRVLLELKEPTEPRGGAWVMDQIIACAERLAREVGGESAVVRHLVVGVPGAVDPRSQRISHIPNIRGLDGFDLLDRLRSHFGPEVMIDNDVNLAMLGEHVFGNARSHAHAAFVALGTGAGLGLLLDGALYRGARGAAGEIADMPVAQDPPLPRGPAAVAFEHAVGSQAILDRYRREGGADATTVRDLFALAERGDGPALAVVDATARAVAHGVVTLHALLDLEVIVLGGSIGRRGELVERVQQLLPTLAAQPIRVVPSALGERAGLVGALWACGRPMREGRRPSA